MIAVVQRVLSASVTVEDPTYSSSIEQGLLILLGVETTDDETSADWMAGKLARLRIFKDEQDRMNRSVQEAGGEVLLVSQFTLLGNTAKGNRPSFIQAAEPVLGETLYERVALQLRDAHDLDVKTGVFGAMMQVQLVNDGPVTLIVNTPPSG
ncbi:MAG: D-aminoacyl-tRNA deacylase [Planctomycetota bacterium]|nr:D-aminoacyl-tRNA deacylase [Planctomycetota bacterium]